MLKPGGSILINTRRQPEVFTGLFSYKPGLVHGLAVARQDGLNRHYNTTMVGACGSFSGHVGIEPIMEAAKDTPGWRCWNETFLWAEKASFVRR